MGWDGNYISEWLPDHYSNSDYPAQRSVEVVGERPGFSHMVDQMDFYYNNVFLADEKMKQDKFKNKLKVTGPLSLLVAASIELRSLEYKQVGGFSQPQEGDSLFTDRSGSFIFTTKGASLNPDAIIHLPNAWSKFIELASEEAEGKVKVAGYTIRPDKGGVSFSAGCEKEIPNAYVVEAHNLFKAWNTNRTTNKVKGVVLNIDGEDEFITIDDLGLIFNAISNKK